MNAPSISTQMASQFDVWFLPHPNLQGKSLMEHLFDRLDGAYPHKWRSNFPNQDAIDNWMTSWAEAFQEESIKPADIKAGLKACRTKHDWPPSCAEFIKACKPALDPLVAYYEAVAGVQARAAGEMGKWSHPAIFWAAMPMAFDLGQQPFSQIKSRWERALVEQMDKGEWAAIPQPMIALPEPGKGVLSRENAAKLVQQYKASEVTKTAASKTDHLLWAKLIMQRVERKDRSLSMLQINSAKQALGVA